jgi:endo-1,4-beta-xylanase
LYIEKAFIKARETDPKCNLVYNEANIEELNGSDMVYALFKNYKERGILIDAIGSKFHLESKRTVNFLSVAKKFQRFADLGLEILITEVDVSLSSHPGKKELGHQAEIYRETLRIALSQPKCVAFQT